jgi:hypothetical protein
MAMIDTVFDAPQWKWRAAPGPTEYAYVHNDVLVDDNGRETSVFVVVPTEFFQFLDQVLSDDEKETVRREGVQFFLEVYRLAGACYFGFESLDSSVCRLLWRYTLSTIPPWTNVAIA